MLNLLDIGISDMDDEVISDEDVMTCNLIDSIYTEMWKEIYPDE